MTLSQTADRRDPGRWVLKREISIGDLVALIVAIVAVLVSYGKLDTRVTVIEAAQITQAKDNDTFRSDVKIDLRDIKQQVQRIAESMPRNNR